MTKITWIISTGNSDIQLLKPSEWQKRIEKYNRDSKRKYKLKSFKPSPNPKFKINGKIPHLLETRVLGAVAQSSDDYKVLDLTFPLLDSFANKLQHEDIKIKPDRIIIFLTDQDCNFSDKDKSEMSCPFWQDTCEAKPIFEWYFKNHEWLKDADLDFRTLKPEVPNNFALSDWDKTLPFLQKVFNEISGDKKEVFYISHQAGTPAISSAIQFISLNRFGNNVNFLVGNEVAPNSAEILESSKYLKYLFIGQAKELLRKGNPAAALQLLKGLVAEDILTNIEDQVKKFNLKSEDTDQNNEFEPLAAAGRVRDALDLIEIFLGNENYLQAIALLAAAQETFLKSSIQFLIRSYIEDQADFPIVGHWVIWDKKGLYLKTTNDRKIIQSLDSLLDIPSGTFQKYKSWNKDVFLIGNTYLFSWLKKLCSKYLNLDMQDWVWGNLSWSMKYIREYDYDLRNQLMHNLRGVEKGDLIDYLKGKDIRDRQDESEKPDNVFKSAIKTQFVSVMSKIFFNADGTPAVPNETENHIQNELNTLADNLDKSLTPENSPIKKTA